MILLAHTNVWRAWFGIIIYFININLCYAEKSFKKYVWMHTCCRIILQKKKKKRDKNGHQLIFQIFSILAYVTKSRINFVLNFSSFMRDSFDHLLKNSKGTSWSYSLLSLINILCSRWVLSLVYCTICDLFAL